MDQKAKFPVLVTGFGPFGRHKVNISWEIAKVLPTMDLQKYGIDLRIQEIPVVYDFVSKEVPLLWKKHEPKLVIHMGVSNHSGIMVETLAHKKGYKCEDVEGKLPQDGNAIGDEDVYRTGLKAKELVDKLKKIVKLKIPIGVSDDAGRYVCEFTFYTSLNINRKRVIFVHLPDFSKGFTVQELAVIIKQIILLLAEQVTNPCDAPETLEM